MLNDVLDNKCNLLLVWISKTYVLLLEEHSLPSNKCEWNLTYAAPIVITINFETYIEHGLNACEHEA